jgi:DNA topoisomerase VI subunit A
VQFDFYLISHFSNTGKILIALRRDIYYRDPELFMKQEVVDRYVGDIAYTLGVERDALNVASIYTSF